MERSDAIKSERSAGGLRSSGGLLRKSGARRFLGQILVDRTDRPVEADAAMLENGDARALAIREFAALPQLIDGN